jgi:hypothetical protein
MFPDRALDEPFHDARTDVVGGREEERGENPHAGDRDGGQELPEGHHRDRDEQLEDEEFGARHE